MTTFSQTDGDDIAAAASLLYSVGRSDRCNPAVRIHCLTAADQLHVAGAALVPADLAPSDAIEATIRAAMGHLGRLAPATFALLAILEAADEAQTALERYEDSRADA